VPPTREPDPSGRRSRDGADAIEFLAPDARAFGDVETDAHAGTFAGFDSTDWDDAEADRAPRSRWAPALAGLAVAGQLAGGVIAASPWSADDTGAAPTTVSSTPPTSIAAIDPEPAGTLVVAELGVEGWVFDPPVAGLTAVAFAQDPEGDDQNTAAGRNGWAEVWATDGATRTSGRWFSSTLRPGGELEPFAFGWAAVDADGRQAMARRDRDGVLELRVAPNADDLGAGELVAIQSFGFSLPEAIGLATSIVNTAGGPPVTAPGDDGVARWYDGLTMVAARPSSDDLVDLVLVGGSSTSTVFYAGPGRRDVSLLERRSVDAIEPALARLAFTPTLAIDPTTAFDGFVPDRFETGTRSIDGIDVNVVRWSVGDDDVWLLTTLSSGVLPAMLDDARRVTRDEWASARDEAERAEPGAWALPEDEEIPVAIADGTTATGTEWVLAAGPRSGQIVLKVPGIGSVDTSFDALVGVARDGAVGTMVVDGSTLVLAAIDQEGATLRVRMADGTERTTTLTPLPPDDDPPTEPGRLDPSFWTSWSGAQVGVVMVDPEQVALGAYVAEVLADDGTVVATLDLFAAP
jgi:hypothetical protein